uniref:Uncharacterized protein n=1 Tax=Candidatus Nitrotoga fabula TaxID=2182327 RepID=A0A2X0QR43_9PROT|nr:protein of unknown function [Candidatus Nitrotoga fabula]
MATNRYKPVEAFVSSSRNRADRGKTRQSNPESKLWFKQRNRTVVDKPTREDIISPSAPSVHAQLTTLIFSHQQTHWR